MEISKRALTLLVGLSAAALVAGCEDGGTATGAASSPAAVASAADPSIREAATAAPAADVGHTVHITSAGIQPRSLISACCTPVVFKNETANPVSVVFFIGKIDSGPIASGASWTWTPPNAESVGYHLGADANQTGQLQIEAPNW